MELSRLSKKLVKWYHPGLLDELAAERKKLLEKESGELQQRADKLAEEITELSGVEPSLIV